MLKNLWDDAVARKYEGTDQLVYRANILGQDPSVTNWKGGNISLKQLEKGFDGQPLRVLRVKGSGSDLKTAVREDFVGVSLDPVLKIQARADADEEMVAYLGHCLTDIPSKRPSIETLMHSFLPYEHIDHTHADYILWFACTEGGRSMAEDLWGERMVWIPYQRPGFSLAKAVSAAVARQPKATCVILEKHGFLSWGATSKECYLSTLTHLQQAEAYVAKRRGATKVFGGARIDSLPNRREIVAAILPAVRGALSANRPMVLHHDDSPEVMEFVNGTTSRNLACVGAACPDHLVSTKMVPYFSSWLGESVEELQRDLVEGAADYCQSYEAYFKEHRGPSDTMDDPYPRILLIPGIGMITTGKNKDTAIAASWLYHRAITVMKGVSALGRFVSLDPAESYGIEYWPLERYKLTQMPPEKEMTGRIAVVTGGASGIGRAAAESLARAGAHVVVSDLNGEGVQQAARELGGHTLGVRTDVTDERAVVELFRETVLAFGGLDTVVLSAGVASASPIEETSLAEWQRLHAILTAGYFLTAREAFKVLKKQGSGGNLVFVVSKNALVAGKNNSAYSSAKAAELHLARCLAEEGGPAGIRVNVVDPDAVISRSTIWSSEWRAARARDHGIHPDELEEFYRKRTTLKRNVLPEDVAEAIVFFASGRASKLTGNLLNVDGGVPAAYRAMSVLGIDPGFIAEQNGLARATLEDDFEHLGKQLARRGLDIEALVAKAQAFSVAIPSWGVGTGGTRFGRFPGPGEPRDVYEKLDDCATIQQLCRVTPEVSLHIPWDRPDDPRQLRAYAAERGLGFAAMNSNTFQDQEGQEHSYKFGSLTHPERAVRRQAIAHNLACLELGQALGSRALTVWIGDGGNFPGQLHFRRALERYLESLSEIYAALPDDFRLFLEHKPYEPALYSTVMNDWGTSHFCASQLGPRAFSLVDLGHHAPNVNIEMVVARLIQLGKLAGFHFNDSKYGDDDLDAGSIKPFQLFLIFNELVDAELEGVPDFQPAHMLDQSHNVTDPVESLMTSAAELQRAYVQAHLVDRRALSCHQQACDALMALQALKQAFTTDVTPILAMARRRAGGAIDPVATFRKSGHRARKARERPAVAGGRGGGIV